MRLGGYDRIIILSVVLSIFISFFLVSGGEDGRILVVYNGDERRVCSLDDSDFTVDGKHGHLKVLVRDGRVRIIESDCPDGLCRQAGWISRQGQSLVCLPGRIALVIEKESRGNHKNNEEYDSITR